MKKRIEHLSLVAALVAIPLIAQQPGTLPPSEEQDGYDVPAPQTPNEVPTYGEARPVEGLDEPYEPDPINSDPDTMPDADSQARPADASQGTSLAQEQPAVGETRAGDATELPKTASPLALLALAGGAGGAAAAALRKRRRR